MYAGSLAVNLIQSSMGGGGEGVWKLNKICFGIKHTPVQSYEINPYSSQVKNCGIIPQSDEDNRFEMILHHSELKDVGF